MLDFFVFDIKLQAIYKVIHTSNYDGHRVTCLVVMGSPFDNEQVCRVISLPIIIIEKLYFFKKF